MSEQTAEQAQGMREHGLNLFAKVGDVVTKSVMVGLGTLGLAQDELTRIVHGGENFLQKLEERGEEMTQSGRETLDKQRDNLNASIETRQDRVREIGTRANESFEKASGTVLTMANIPTSADIQALSKQISALNRKVDRLRKEQEALAEQRAEAQQEETPAE